MDLSEYDLVALRKIEKARKSRNLYAAAPANQETERECCIACEEPLEIGDPIPTPFAWKPDTTCFKATEGGAE